MSSVTLLNASELTMEREGWFQQRWQLLSNILESSSSTVDAMLAVDEAVTLKASQQSAGSVV